MRNVTTNYLTPNDLVRVGLVPTQRIENMTGRYVPGGGLTMSQIAMGQITVRQFVLGAGVVGLIAGALWSLTGR